MIVIKLGIRMMRICGKKKWGGRIRIKNLRTVYFLIVLLICTAFTDANSTTGQLNVKTKWSSISSHREFTKIILQLLQNWDERETLIVFDGREEEGSLRAEIFSALLGSESAGSGVRISVSVVKVGSRNETLRAGPSTMELANGAVKRLGRQDRLDVVVTWGSKFVVEEYSRMGLLSKSFTIIWNDFEDLGKSMIWSSCLRNIKYKTVVRVSEMEEAVYFSSICFYCNLGLPVTRRMSFDYKSGESMRKLVNDVIFEDFTKDFHGKEIQVWGGSSLPSLNRFGKTKDGRVQVVGGFQSYSLFALQQKLNFRMNISTTWAFGGLVNGSYTGLVGVVHSGEAELGIAAAINLNRFLAVDFVSPNRIHFITFSTAFPTHEIKWDAILSVVSGMVWLVLLGICFVFIFPLYLTIRNWGKVAVDIVASMWGELLDFWTFLLRGVLEEPPVDDHLDELKSGKVIIIAWLFFCLIFGTAYKSKLVSTMVSPRQETIPNSFEELARSSYRIYVHGSGGALQAAISTAPTSAFQDIRKRMRIVNSLVDCVGHSLEPKTACIAYQTSLEIHARVNFTDKRGQLGFRISPYFAFSVPSSFLVPRGAVYRDSVHNYVIQHSAMGLDEYAWKEEINVNKRAGLSWARSCKNSTMLLPANGIEAFTLEHLSGPFVIVIVGLCLSTLLFGTEFFFFKIRLRSRVVRVRVVQLRERETYV